jgi:hypothetical protein
VSDERVLCPSARCEVGAVLLGIVLPNGHVAFASRELRVDRDFVEAACEGRSPEKRFRFSSPCARAACKQWTGSRCSVIDEVRAAVDHRTAPAALPACSIRPRCRWFLQSGPEACAVCPLIVTDGRLDSESNAEYTPSVSVPDAGSPIDPRPPRRGAPKVSTAARSRARPSC